MTEAHRIKIYKDFRILQPDLLRFANSKYGRVFLGIDDFLPNKKITQLFPNGWASGKKQQRFSSYRILNRFTIPVIEALANIKRPIETEDFIFGNLIYPSHLAHAITYADASDIAVYKGDATYATAHDALTGDGTQAGGDAAELECINRLTGTYLISRPIIPFDTTGRPDVVASATFNIQPSRVLANADSDSYSIVQATPATWNSIITADYDQLGTTKGATDIAYGSLSNGVYAIWTMNATGIGWIANGTWDLGMRTAKDIANAAPTGDNDVRFKSADTAGTTSDPYIDIIAGEADISSFAYFM